MDESFLEAPYHLMGVPDEDNREDCEIDFLLFCMDRFTREYFGAEIDDLGNIFGHNTTYVAHSCLAMGVYLEVAWICGIQFVFPMVPDLMKKTPSRRGIPPPKEPKCKKGQHPENLTIWCRDWWLYYLALIQFWWDEICENQYGGPVCPDSKIMLFVYYRAKEVFSAVGLDLHYYAVKNATPWGNITLKNFTDEQLTTQRKMYHEVINEQKVFKVWMYKRYKAEAELELKELQHLGGDLDKMPPPRKEKWWHPVDKEQFDKEMKEKAKNQDASSTPRYERTLEHQCQWQEESRTRKAYTRDRAEVIWFEVVDTPSPMVFDDTMHRLCQTKLNRQIQRWQPPP